MRRHRSIDPSTDEQRPKGRGALIREEWNEAFPPDPQHPVRTSLRTAFLNRLAQFADLVPKDGGLSEFLRVMPELTKLNAELSELRAWVFEPLSKDQDSRLPDTVGELLKSEGFSFSDIKEVVDIGSKRPRGRPVSKRLLAVRALQAKLLDKNRTFSWMRFAVKHCDCAKPRHDSHCKEAIRQEVMVLQRLLSKYGLLPEAWPQARPHRTVKV